MHDVDNMTDSDEYVEREERAGIQHEDGNGATTHADAVLIQHLTDLGNARRFELQHAGRVRYCSRLGGWYLWDGTRWKPDEIEAVYQLGRQTVATIWLEIGLASGSDQRVKVAKWAQKSESADRLAAMLRLARSGEGIATPAGAFDRNHWLLNVQNGTVDLRTGELRPHREADLITKLAPVAYDPHAEAPLWDSFLALVFANRDNLVRYVQRAAGYSLSGDVREHVLFIDYGTGENGKSTFLDTLRAVLGDHAVTADPDLLMQSRGEKHPTGLARLAGARLVTAIETSEGRRLAESLVKWMTGGDRLTARKMREDFFEFDPTHKLWLATNHKPVIRGTDHAMWRRIHLVPFIVCIPKVTTKIEDFSGRLRAEWSGILRWAVEGCLAWQRDGLNPPDEVRAATEDYRVEMDTLGLFLLERCEIERDAMVGATELHKAYVAWSEERKESYANQTVFGTRLTERGFTKRRSKSGMVYDGLRVR